MNPVLLNIKSSLGANREVRELLPLCPEEFFSPKNLWGKAALNFAKQDPREVLTDHWQWKLSTENERQKAKASVYAIAASFWLTSEEKLALAGWVFSEALIEIPV